MAGVAKQLQILMEVGSLAGRPDRVLLERFLEAPPDMAEAAFAALVERHGAMVRRVCRQITGDHHDAEDAAQATFLVLARRARSARAVDSLAGWLYGVARRVSTRANADAARRRARERKAAKPADAQTSAPEPWPWPEIHEELARLPARYRPPIVLCYFEGLSHEQAAGRLGCPIRTLQTRLARGRARLRARLERRGLGPAAGSLAIAPRAETVSAAWAGATARASARFAEAKTAPIAESITRLAEGALKSMSFMKMKSAVAAMVLIALAAGGVGGLAQQAAPPPNEPPALAPAPAPPPAPTPNPYLRKTQGGGTIEIVGVSRWPSGPKTWWRPDGTPLDEPPGGEPGGPPELPDPGAPSPDPDAVDGLYSVFFGQDSRVAFVLAIRCKNTSGFAFPRQSELEIPIDAKTSHVLPGTSLAELTASRPMGLWILPSGQETGVFRFGVASVPWSTQGVIGVRPDWTYGVAEMGSKLGAVFLSPPRETRAEDEGRTVVVTTSIVEQDALNRFVAIDRRGETREPSSQSAIQLNQNTWMREVYYDLPREDIKEFQFQTRPIERMEIPNITLPSRPGPAK